jgi:hypothetical protein
MSEYVHARCGGLLVEISRPDWWPRGLGVSHGYNSAVLARCDKCNRPGEVARGPASNLETVGAQSPIPRPPSPISRGSS